MATQEQDANGLVSVEISKHDAVEKLSISTPLLDHAVIENCVVCLEDLVQNAITLPCRHDNFHFLCLVTWLQQSRVCPLCKTHVAAVQYRDHPTGEQQIFYLDINGNQPHSTKRDEQTIRSNRRVRRRSRLPSYASDAGANRALLFRKYVYEHKLYSLYVGSNAMSHYRSLTPYTFSQDEKLVAKAKKWIRRELKVFESRIPNTFSSEECQDRRANNAEFLLSYIIAILQNIDIKGSAGQAEELLQEFLGRDDARLFLHELEAFLRSPFLELNEWDKAVQYCNT